MNQNITAPDWNAPALLQPFDQPDQSTVPIYLQSFNNMKAVRVKKEGESTHLSVEDIEKPTISEGQLLVKIRASFVQPADILNSKGGFPTTVSQTTLLP